jgi:polysaccharide pyruvyl transferase WcaK-like protein
MSAGRLLLYGHFGTGNFGNDSTLEAMLHNVGRLRPDADVACVCTGPDVVAERYGIPALPAHALDSSNGGGNRSRMMHVALRLASRGADEIDFWRKRPGWLRSFDQFIIVGTGAVDDMASRPWKGPYDMARWCRAAHMAGARVVFLSVGAGPIVNRASRTLMLGALRLADYRSYRDVESADYLQSVGFDSEGDPIYPDLVFSLPIPGPQPREKSDREVRAVGLGVIGYYGWRHDAAAGEPVYQEYIAKVKAFLSWLLDQGYAVRILHGDLGADPRPVDDLLSFAQAELPAAWQERVIAEPVSDTAGLFRQIDQCDLVIANRFHNVVYSLMLGRPVVSIGYHWKNDALMADMGMATYCQHIERFTVGRLVEQFQALVAEREEAAQRIQHKCAQYRKLLDEQYRNVLCPEGELATL